MAKVLVVTGTLAADMVRKAVKEVKKHDVDVLVMPIPVAAFITPEMFVSYAERVKLDLKTYDYVLLPGLSRGSAKIIEERLGVKAVKGPIHAYDLSVVLELEDLSILSSEEPADVVVGGKLVEEAKRILEEVERNSRLHGCIRVGQITVPALPPPIRVASEISFAHTLNDEMLLNRASRYLNDGADIIVLGFEAYNPHPDDVERTVKTVKRYFDVPLAVDSSIPSEISRAVKAGADMILNVNPLNVDSVVDYLKDVAVVVVPVDPSTSAPPKDPSMRVILLEKLISNLKSRGVTKILADAVLDPPYSVFKSLLSFYEFKLRNPDVPLLMGVGNVTELMDVDSVGVNGLLAVLAQEVGASILLTVEASQKTKGSTRELKTASQMVAISYYKGVPPKNLGLDMLILKDKRLRETPLEVEGAEIVEAPERGVEYPLDPLGVFKIRVNHDEGVIEALYVGSKGKILIKGRTAKSVGDAILIHGLISQLSHAMYLGRELAKAEEALRLSKNYVQEFPLFKSLEFIRMETRDSTKSLKA